MSKSTTNIFEAVKKTRSMCFSFISFTKSILKSLVILAMWLALGGTISSQIALLFALNRIFFSPCESKPLGPGVKKDGCFRRPSESGTVKQNNQSDFTALFKLTNHITGKWKIVGTDQSSSCI